MLLLSLALTTNAAADNFNCFDGAVRLLRRPTGCLRSRKLSRRHRIGFRGGHKTSPPTGRVLPESTLIPNHHVPAPVSAPVSAPAAAAADTDILDSVDIKGEGLNGEPYHGWGSPVGVQIKDDMLYIVDGRERGVVDSIPIANICDLTSKVAPRSIPEAPQRLLTFNDSRFHPYGRCHLKEYTLRFGGPENFAEAQAKALMDKLVRKGATRSIWDLKKNSEEWWRAYNISKNQLFLEGCAHLTYLNIQNGNDSFYESQQHRHSNHRE